MSLRESSIHMVARFVLPMMFLLAAFSLVACSRSYREPTDMVPTDAGAWLAVRSVDDISVALNPLVARVPELRGAVDLVRSVSGMDLTGADVESGFDSRRGAIAALWREGMLVVLPVSRAGAVRRSVGLKLSSHGFVEVDGASGLKEFDSPERGHACLHVRSGLAILFVGPREACSSLAGMVETPKADEVPAVLPVAAVNQELGTTRPDVAFFVSNKLFAPELLKLAGLPTRGAAALVARGFIGDLRGVVSLDGGVSFRIAVGASGRPFKGAAVRQACSGPLSVDVTVGPSARPIVDTAISLATRRVKGLDQLAGAWSGALRFVATAKDVGQAAPSTGAKAGPIRDILGRFNVKAAAGLREEVPVVLEQIGRGFGAVKAEENADFVDFSVAGIAFRASGSGRELALAASPVPFTPGAATASSPGLPELTDGPRLVSICLDPDELLEATGFASVDYLKHLVDPLQAVLVDGYYEGGRVLLDGRVNVR